MRSENFFFLLVLITFSLITQNNSFEFSNLDEVKELRETSYGNSLIETISLTFQNKGSVQEVQKLLTDLLYKLNKDQEDSDKSWELELRNFNSKIDKLKNEIELLRVNVSTLTQKNEEYKAKEEISNKTLNNYQKQLSVNKNNLADLNNRRTKDKAQYKISVSDHNDMINALDAVISELTKVEELESPKVVKMPELLTGSPPPSTHENMLISKNSFLQVDPSKKEFSLSQLTAKETKGSINQLITILQNLQVSAKKSLNDDEKHEQKSVESYNFLIKSLNEDINKLDKSIEEEEKNLKQYSIEIANLSSKIEHLSSLKQSKESELQSTNKESNDKSNQNSKDKEQRIVEKNIVVKLQNVVNNRIQSMSRFLKDKTGA